MVKENELTVHLPGGARLSVQNDKMGYNLTDHLNSTRLAVARDNAISDPTNYTPFGDNPTDTTDDTNLVGHYTGMSYEAETATYDYHARAYDPTIARFTSVDAIRQSISPYSYTENNPINFVDSNGLGKVSFWLYSSTFAPNSAKSTQSTIDFLDLPVIVLDLENRQRINSPLLNSGSSVQHLIINVDSQLIAHRYPNAMDGSLFAKNLSRTLIRSHPQATSEVKSIFLHGCGLVCNPYGPKEDSFAGKFFDSALSEFPNLRSVFASPYKVDIGTKKWDETTTNIDASVVGDNKHKISFEVSTRDYYEGNPESLRYLFDPPSQDTISSIIDRPPMVEDDSPSDFIRRNGFFESVFYNFAPPPRPKRTLEIRPPLPPPPLPPRPKRTLKIRPPLPPRPSPPPLPPRPLPPS